MGRKTKPEDTDLNNTVVHTEYARTRSFVTERDTTANKSDFISRPNPLAIGQLLINIREYNEKVFFFQLIRSKKYCTWLNQSLTC